MTSPTHNWWYGKHAAEAVSEAASGSGPEIGGVNWQTMIFIGGMMVMVEGMGAAGFFRWLCLLVAKIVKYRVIPIFITFMLLSGFLSMFIDSITVMLFLATVTIELARLLKFDPVPVIIAEIFASNTGGSATMSGDPPNIIIGTHFNYTFADFAANTGPIAWASMIVVLLLFYLFFRKSLRQQAADNPVKSPGSVPSAQRGHPQPPPLHVEYGDIRPDRGAAGDPCPDGPFGRPDRMHSSSAHSVCQRLRRKGASCPIFSRVWTGAPCSSSSACSSV